MKQQDILNCISAENIKNKLRLNEIYSTRDTIYVTCPFCNSKKGSMKLNKIYKTYVCKDCDEKGYLIGLYAKLKGISNKDAYKKLTSSKPEIERSYNIDFLVNNIKSDDELDCIYSFFLKQLNLSSEHTMKLLNYGFTLDEINEIGFKSIPNNEQEKIRICKKMIEEGYILQGTPGFYQDKKFRWTFNSHKGMFIPIKENHKINSLRIHLDSMYNTDTTDIWFSSNNKYNGTKAINRNMILYPETSALKIINNKLNKDIFIATEMLLAYKTKKIFEDSIVIAIPNTISKKELTRIKDIIDINHIDLILDTHTVLHGSENLIKAFYSIYGENKVEIHVSINNCEIPDKLIQKYNNNMQLKCA